MMMLMMIIMIKYEEVEKMVKKYNCMVIISTTKSIIYQGIRKVRKIENGIKKRDKKVKKRV